ncbi:hypothetical protein EYZ11_011667 [Aspergillus tanneri]|uniref:Uncharacterized protein n=1 Tax=Aspergillus tanneri TaxID=1220188 RepID=A0A4S3J275_9EURO|nr:hypothetical protein EYZ11_011667 [Aspergillus tanneri]
MKAVLPSPALVTPPTFRIQRICRAPYPTSFGRSGLLTIPTIMKETEIEEPGIPVDDIASDATKLEEMAKLEV